MYRRELDFLLNSNTQIKNFMLYGDEYYQVEYYAKILLDKIGSNPLRLSFDEYDFNRAKSHLEEDSLFGDLNILHIKTDKKIPLKELKILVELTKQVATAFFIYELHDGEQKSLGEHVKVFGENFARFFEPNSEKEAIELLQKHAKKLNLNIKNQALLAKIYNIQNQNIYLSAAELNRLATSSQEIDEALIERLITSLSKVSFESLFNSLLACKNIKNDLADFFENNAIDEIAFINMLYREFSRLFKIYSAYKINPMAKFQDILGYSPPPHVQNILKAQANKFCNALFLEIFMHLNECDYMLKKPKNNMDKNLFLLYGILKLQNIIAKYSKY